VLNASNGSRSLGVRGILVALAGVAACALLLYAQHDDDRLWALRNLGKAFYENPTTQTEAVEQFRQALALTPNSAREQLNYGLALLRAGDLDKGIAQLEKVQKLDPKLPHTWFNLGVVFQKQGEFDRAFEQFQGMIKLVPNEPVSHYHLGALYKIRSDPAAAIREFETARRLNPRLAAPHFQLYNMYRQAGRMPEATAELRTFQDLKKQQEGAAVPEDMDWCWYAEIYDPVESLPPAPKTAPAYRDEKIGDGFTGFTLAVVDGGTRPDIIAWSRDRVTIFRNGTQAVESSGLEGLKDVVFIAPGDFDNDGLPDLCVITKRGAELYRNQNGKFHKQADLAAGSFRTAVWMDYDHDYDPDLFLLGDDSRLLRNNGTAGFSDESKRFPFVAGRATDARRYQAEPDTPGFDLLVAYEGREPVLYRDRLGGNYEATFGPAKLPPPNDVADFRGDGRADRAVIKDGGLVIEREVSPNYGNWIGIALTGVKNAKLSLDAKVEIKAGASYQKATYEGVPLLFRLDGERQVDTVRITWPNGLIQNEVKQPLNRLVEIKEAPRLSGSCPMIFTWNGNRFEFITDVLGVAPLGASSGDGQYFPVDHDEYVSIAGERLKPRDGHYDVRISEELREVSYIDQVKLIALDHPADTEIVTNEKFKSPPFPEFRLFGVKRRVYPVAAHDSHGADVLPALLKRDGIYPDGFRHDHDGRAEMHYLDLDFGTAASSNRAVLVLNGYVHWADGSTFLAAMQEHRDLTFPYIQVKDAAGQWKTVVEDMGIPSGKPKSMAVDLTGKFLSASREVRIVTSMCLYWDEAFLVEDSAPPPARMTAVPMLGADLHFRGFSRMEGESFDYRAVSPTSMWNPTPGRYTRYGAVEGLLAERDDCMVVMGSGDEIALRFRAGGLPDLPAGWRRDFLLLVDGWAKDADANTAFSQSVLPLPFHGMSSYPYPKGEHYPDDTVHQAYVRTYLTRPALRLIRRLTD
jgi:tetratricopeptide (TPR) repeat protein